MAATANATKIAGQPFRTIVRKLTTSPMTYVARKRPLKTKLGTSRTTIRV